MKTTTVDIPFREFTEDASTTLNEGDLVSINSSGNAIAATSSTEIIGVMKNRLYVGNKQVTVQLFGATARVTQASAITCGTAVEQNASTPLQVETFAAGGRRLGVKLSPATTGAAGDIIEIMLNSGFVVGVAA